MMKESGLVADKMTFQTLLQGCQQAGSWRRLVDLVREGCSSKIALPVDVLNQALHAMQSKGCPEAQQLHQLMMANRLFVTVGRPKAASQKEGMGYHVVNKP